MDQVLEKGDTKLTLVIYISASQIKLNGKFIHLYIHLASSSRGRGFCCTYRKKIK